jgi:hypothetical protein
VKFGRPLLQVSACNTTITMPRGFKKVKLCEPMKVNRMQQDDPKVHQQQMANSEDGDEAAHDDTLRTTLSKSAWAKLERRDNRVT